MPQKYKIFLNEKVLNLEHQSGTNKRKNIPLILNPEDLLQQVDQLQFRSDFKEITLLSPVPLTYLLKKTFKVVKAAGGLVFNESGLLLFIKRHGLWDLPKGKIHPDEGLQEGALREVSEETGLTQLQILEKAGDTYHLYFHKGRYHLKDTTWYLMKYTGNETPVPQQEEDITAVQWCTASDIPKILENTYLSLKNLITNNLPQTSPP